MQCVSVLILVLAAANTVKPSGQGEKENQNKTLSSINNEGMFFLLLKNLRQNFIAAPKINVCYQLFYLNYKAYLLERFIHI